MEVVAAGAMKALLPKLGELLKDEYNLEKRVREGVRSLETELTMMHAALRKVAEVQRDQLDEQVRIWAGKVRELSYDMEDAVDAFMVDRERELAANPKSIFKRFFKKATKLLRKGKALHPIADAIKDAQGLAEQLAALRQRYELELHDSSSSGATIDPRLTALYKEETELVGIDGTRDELIRMLTQGADDASMQQLKIISIVGFGGLGKTTIAKAVYEKIKEQFHCGAFVSVSRKPDITTIFKNMLYQLGKYANIKEATILIDELREFLRDKRYFIIIDDIWDEKLWGYIKCAFKENNLGSRLITTTRNVNVSKACCSSNDDIYKMKPLSVDDSKRLFYKRIFSQDNECPHELEDVSKDILKKCGWVPLAIITIAGLLANKEIQTKDQWYTLCNSIGHGLTEGAKVEDMQMILSFSYYDLPSHLKPCLLYLSIFPEDYEIKSDRLIWRWIAEGFVQHDKNGLDSEFELGKNYFNELINRSMIQPVKIDAEDKANACRVHDMVLDLIYHLSSEENFVTVLDGLEQNTSSQRKVRRLSLQNCMTELTTPQATISMSQVRSFTIFRPAIKLMPSLSCFHVIRVLDLEGCALGKSCHLNLGYVKFLFHLRYLGLRNTCIPRLRGPGLVPSYPGITDTYVVRELPTEIENLQFLQTLDIREAGIEELPPTVVRLRRLMCLHVFGPRLPDGFGNLTSLEELSEISTSDYADVVKELSQLTKLRVLKIMWEKMDERMATAFVECLGNLHKLQSLEMYAYGCGYLNLMREGWVPPPQLRRFWLNSVFSTLPTWINSSLFMLSYLHIWVDEVGREDIQILGTLPALRSLFLAANGRLEEHPVQRFVVSAGAFECARECTFLHFVTVPSMFPQGAMPRVRLLEFCLRAWDFANGDFGSHCLHMGNLPSLERVVVCLWCKKASVAQVEEVEAALRHAADVHPNHPTISIQTWGSSQLRCALGQALLGRPEERRYGPARLCRA